MIGPFAGFASRSLFVFDPETAHGLSIAALKTHRNEPSKTRHRPLDVEASSEFAVICPAGDRFLAGKLPAEQT